MFKILSDRVYANKEDFVTHNIIRDLSRLIKTNSGKIAAGPGFHDDSIMSYLIAMYVYVYGNNLAVFGIHKGHDADFVPNQGMKRPEDIDPTLVDPKLINEAIANAKKEQAAHEWDRLYKEAIQRSQKESYKLSKAGLSDTIYDNSADAAVYDNEFSDIDMDFFNEINRVDRANAYQQNQNIFSPANSQYWPYGGTGGLW